MGRLSLWLSLMQAASARSLTAILARMRWRVRVLWRSSLSRSLRVQNIDSICWRIGARCGPGRVRLCGVVAARRAVALVDGVGELAAGVALVGDDRFSAVKSDRQQAERDLAFFLVGWREDRGARGAVRAARRCRRIPQNQREWLRE